MTDTVQGGPLPAVPEITATATVDAGRVERDPMTGINRDMPGQTREAAGEPRNLTFGGPYHK